MRSEPRRLAFAWMSTVAIPLAILPGCGESTAARPMASSPIEITPRELVVDASSGSERTQLREVSVRNISDVPVRIGKIETTCGCTVPEPLANALLNPGEARTLTLNVKVPSFGEQRSRVMIHIEPAPGLDGKSAPQMERLEVQLRALTPGAPFVTAVPRTIHLGGGPPPCTDS